MMYVLANPFDPTSTEPHMKQLEGVRTPTQDFIKIINYLFFVKKSDRNYARYRLLGVRYSHKQINKLELFRLLI